MSSDDLKKIFVESIGSTKAYFVSKVQQKYPRLDKKDIETWFKSQESSNVMYNLGVGPRFAYVSASARPQNNKLPWGPF